MLSTISLLQLVCVIVCVRVFMQRSLCVRVCAGDVIISDCQQRTFSVFAADGQLRHHVAVEPWPTVETSMFQVVGLTDNSYAVGEMDDNRVLQLSVLHADATSGSGNFKVGYKTAHSALFTSLLA